MVNKKAALFLAFFIFLLSGFFSYSFFSKGGSAGLLSPLAKLGSNYTAPTSNGNGEAVSNEPKTEECPLNGELLTKTQKAKWDIRRPLGVMIENHKDARPQSGLSSADVIYEAVAEGGITRFLAIFYCKDAPYIGPVRSARMYFVKMLEEYGNNPLYGHVGGANTPGSANALGYINELGWGLYNDMNQFAVPFPYYWRDYERLPNRVTEHTVYSSTSKLWQYAKDNRKLTNVDEKGVTWDKGFTKWKFADDAATAERGTVAKIDFGFWNSFATDYAIVWNYDKVRNTYKRDNGGVSHMDKNTGKALETKNVVVFFTKESPANDGYEGGHILYKVVGVGDALVFQNGNAIKASWSKVDEATRIKFTNSLTGKEIPMVRGQVFIEILPIGNKVTY